MNLEELKAQYYFFEKGAFGTIYVLIDFGNVRPWAKDFWPEENRFRYCVEIDIEKLADVCSWVNPKKKIFYYGYFAKRDDLPENHEYNIKHKTSIFRIDKARKSGFEIRSKEVKMIPRYNEEGKYLGKIPKCNFDVEITKDAITKMEKYNTIMLFSGDSDFGDLLSYLKEKGKKIIVVCTRNRMSVELEKVADKFIPAETLKNFLRYENTPPVKAEV
ncbi:MAG: NYN domain-containing protein [Candidatus Falkowbacteria bacterium]